MQTRLVVLAAAFSCLVLGCPLGGQSKPARAQEAALELNLNARFGRMELAAERVSPKAREAFFERRKHWGGRVRVADYELAGLRILEGESEAETVVKVAWYRIDEGDLHVTTIRQTWHDFKGDWKLTGETRVDGELGLLGETAPVTDAGASPLPRRAHFPTVHLGGGGAPEDVPPAVQPSPAIGEVKARGDAPSHTPSNLR